MSTKFWVHAQLHSDNRRLFASHFSNNCPLHWSQPQPERFHQSNKNNQNQKPLNPKPEPEILLKSCSQRFHQNSKNDNQNQTPLNPNQNQKILLNNCSWDSAICSGPWWGSSHTSNNMMEWMHSEWMLNDISRYVCHPKDHSFGDHFVDAQSHVPLPLLLESRWQQVSK
jgi:hypothetical protein